jgi:hypothetical protein
MPAIAATCLGTEMARQKDIYREPMRLPVEETAHYNDRLSQS